MKNLLLLGLTLASLPTIAGMKNQDVNCRVSFSTSTFNGEETIRSESTYFDLKVNDVVSKDGSSRIKSRGTKEASLYYLSQTFPEEGLELLKDNFSISKHRFLANRCNGVDYRDHFRGELSLSKEELRSVVKLLYPDISPATVKRGVSLSDKTSYECYGPEEKEIEILEDEKYLRVTLSCGTR